MIKIEVEQDIIDKAERYVERYNIGQRSHSNGTKFQQRNGLIGQTYFKHHFTGEHFDFDSPASFDGGVDLVMKGYKIDVKTISRRSYATPDSLCDFQIEQMEFDCDIIAFVNFNYDQNVVELVGWCWKKDIPMIAHRIIGVGDEIYYRDTGKTVIAKRRTYSIKFGTLNKFKNENRNDIGRQ